MRPDRSDAIALIAAGALATALPLVAARYARSLLHDAVEPSFAAALGVPVSIGGVEASLTGAVRIDDVQVGQVASAGAVEASVGLTSLLRGDLGADEIRIERPRLRTRIDEAGEHALRPILERAAAARARRAPAGDDDARARRLRRIIVTDGELQVKLEGRGTLSLHDVQLRPQAGGVRLIAGAVDAQVATGGIRARARFERAGADIALPAMRLDRAVAVGGDVAVAADGGPEVALSEATLAAGIRGPGTATALAETADGAMRIDLDGAALVVRGEHIPLAPLAAIAPGWLDLDTATATGEASVRATAAGLEVRADGALDGAVLDHARLAGEAVPLDGALRIDATLQRGAVTLREARLTRGDTTATASGSLALDASAAALTASLPRTSCIGALHAIPAPARRRLAGIDARGTVSAEVRLRYDRRAPDDTELDVRIDASACDVTREADGADPARVLSAFEHTYPDGTRDTVDPAASRYASYAVFPDHVIGAFVAGEDARFFRHGGFDPFQIERSLAANVAVGELVRGGSTISQQLAKNVFLDHQRTFARKLEEVVVTWRIEQRLSKQQILETYLNVIELGEGVHGVPSAARHWFNRKTTHLSRREAAFLAALTPAPRTLSRQLRERGRIDDDMNARIDVILRAMRVNRWIDERQYRDALAEELILRSGALARR